MIKFFMFVLAALGLGGLLSALLGDDSGYILISFRGYSFETSVVAAVILMLITFLVLYLLLWLLNSLNPFSFIKGRGGFFRSRKQAARETEKGFLLLAEGRTKAAYKKLLENASKAPTPIINYLAAAQAAYDIHDSQGMRFCLGEAEKVSENSSFAIGVSKARMEVDADHQEEALALLQSLHKKDPSHPGVLKLLYKVYLHVQAWYELATLIPFLEKHKIVQAEQLTELKMIVAKHRLQLFDCKKGVVAQLDAIWETVPKAGKLDEVLLGTYLHKLIELGEFARAQVLLIRYFKHNWSDGLVKMIGYVHVENPAEQLVLLEKLMKDRPNNAMLALTLGRVSLRNRLWGKGREYFEAALRFSRDEKLSAEINAELARLYENLGEHERSVACYQKSMSLLDRKLPDLPYPN